jgi:hypothetical protein
LHDLFGNLFLRTPPASIQFLVVVQAELHREGMMLSEIDVELTVVFAIFRLSKAGRLLPELLNF